MNPADCTGYACPPEHSVPSNEVVVDLPGILATTGMDASDPSLWITAGLLILGSGILFTYNHLKHKDESIKVQCPHCDEVLGNYSDYGGVSGKTAQWWADKALYEHVDEVHS